MYKKTIPFDIFMYLSYLLYLLNTGCFTTFKHTYNHFINDLMHRGYNYINEFKFLDDY